MTKLLGGPYRAPALAPAPADKNAGPPVGRTAAAGFGNPHDEDTLAREPPSSPLPTNAKARKDLPLCTGLLDYFPDALIAVAELSRIGNDQHNPGEPLHWARGKSGDEANALLRHLVDRGGIDTDNVRHSTKVCWRALANLQKEIEAATGAGPSRGSK